MTTLFQARNADPARRGSILILAVIVLVLIALMGLAYLQQARMDRFATDEYERDYMPIVINGIMAEIRLQLAEDVFENQTRAEGLYDYPWTSTDIPRTWSVEFGDGSTGFANGEVQDDRWLASTTPLVRGTGTTDFTWTHLTNLGGIWLDMPQVGGTANLPNETLIDAGTYALDNANSDTNLTGTYLDGFYLNNSADYEARGVDTDGDGIKDARWTWAPVGVRDFGGRRYVFAARVIDLSSLLNVNVATPTSNGTGFPGGTTGYTPADIDLARLFKRAEDGMTAMTGNAWDPETDSLMSTRLSAIAPWSGTWPYTADQTLTAWNEQGIMVGDKTTRYPDTEELELRYGGGLNQSLYSGDIEADLIELLRDGSGIESSWQAVADVNNLYEWFQGGTDGSAVDGRAFPSIRHMLTGVSGAAVYAPQYGVNAGTGRLKMDLNFGDARSRSAVVPLDYRTALADRIDRAFVYPIDGATGNPIPPLYLNLTQAQIENEVIPDFTNAIIDYADADYTPSRTSAAFPNPPRYGMERLPLFREAYAQVLYEDRDLLDPANATNPDGFFDTWVALDGTADPADPDTRAMVIELGNPFAHQMNGAQYENEVEIRVLDGATVVSAWIMNNTVPNIPGRDDASTQDVLFIVSPPDTPTAEDDDTTTTGGEGADGSTLPVDLGFDASVGQTVVLPNGTLQFNVNGNPITIELRVLLADGTTWVTYDRFEVDGLPATIVHNDPSTPPGPQTTQQRRYGQQTNFRDSQYINYVVDDLKGGAAQAPTHGVTQSATVDQFDLDAKGGLAQTALIDQYFQIPHPDRLPLKANGYEFDVTGNDRAFYSISELGWILMVGFTDVQTFPQSLAAVAGATPERMFLHIDPATVVTTNAPTHPTFPGSGLPHAAMLFDQFTVVSPRNDGVDNDNLDGDGNLLTNADEETETLVPGTLNINTAPLHLMTLGSPIAESTGNTEALMRTIATYRDLPIRDFVEATQPSYPDWSTATPFVDANIRTLTPMNRSAPGIASLGELLFLNPTNGTTTSDIQAYGADAASLAGTSVDLYPSPFDQNITFPDSQDTAEEALARFQFLAQAYSVRTDVVAAFVRVRGYEDFAFNAGPVEVAHFLAIIDRGSMVAGTTGQASPKVLAFIRYE